MYFQDYYLFMAALLVCGIFSAIASARVHGAYNKYGRVQTHSGMTGYETVQRLMRLYGVQGIAIGCVNGKLSDHYHPTKRVVNLSQETYAGSSVAAVSVAAHEMGHVMQKQQGYFFYKVRTTLVPIVNIAGNLALPLVLVGMVMDAFSLVANPKLGFYLAMVGVAMYSGSLIFCLITLPVELNASRRAREMLLEAGILQQAELKGAKRVLSAAALTYVASLLTSLVYFLRFLIRVLTLFGRRRRD